MSEFSPADAALEGFRLTREHPVGVVVWAVLFFATGLLSGYLMVRTGGAEAAVDFSALGATPTPDPAESLDVMRRYLPSMFLSLAPVLLAQILVQASILRIALRPSQHRAYLAVGGDELRVLGTSLATMFLVMLAIFAVVILSVVLTMIAPALGILAVMGGALAAYLFINTRLSLFAPMAVAEGSFNLGEAWRLTQGRFWRIFGALFLATIFLLIVFALGLVMSSAVRTLAGVDQNDPQMTLARLFHPGEIAASAIESLLQALGMVLVTAPVAAIYRAVKPRNAADVF